MALISMRQLLDHAAEHGYGVPAFNVNNLEQMRAIMEAADQTDSPVIVQASAGARKYAGQINESGGHSECAVAHRLVDVFLHRAQLGGVGRATKGAAHHLATHGSVADETGDVGGESVLLKLGVKLTEIELR